jgi:hypothetical protein
MFHRNIDNSTGRGILLYVQKSLYADEIEIQVQFEENVFVKIKVSNADNMLVGVIYRSPNPKLREPFDVIDVN